MLIVAAQTGQTSCRGLCWAFTLRPKRTSVLHRRSLFTGALSLCPVISWPHHLRDTCNTAAHSSSHGPRVGTCTDFTSRFGFIFRASSPSSQRFCFCAPRCPYKGPFRVLHRGDKTFSINMVGRQELVTVDRLKPAHLDLDQPVQVAQPPRRGHPPRSPGCTNSVSGGAV